MEEVKCEQVATLRGGKWEKTYEESRRVYGIEGISPTVHTQGGGNQEVKILEEPIAYDEQNRYLRQYGTVGTITTDGSSPKPNNRVVEPMCVASRGRNPDNPSDRSAGIYLEKRLEVNENGTSNALTTVQKDNMVLEPKNNYRVRKLTDKECFRLQGVKDEDFERVRKNQSKSSCYHLAGDSITVSVLMALFGEMLDVDWKEKVDQLVKEFCNDE